jgi:uncharacterized protein (TIGR03643 family)
MEKEFSEIEIDRIIEMAWEDRTTFDSILMQFGLKEQEVIDLMRREMKPCGEQGFKDAKRSMKNCEIFVKADLNARVRDK